MTAITRLTDAGLTGIALDRAIAAGILDGTLCGNCDGMGRYHGWRCPTCGATGDGPNANDRELTLAGGTA